MVDGAVEWGHRGIRVGSGIGGVVVERQEVGDRKSWKNIESEKHMESIIESSYTELITSSL